ncbi:MAG: heparinase II/III domain-containing protein [Acutalibacteraceae bacterium]|jgi:hypothetical protein
MGFFVTEEELQAVREAEAGTRLYELYQVLRERCLHDTRTDSLLQDDDTQEWYHLVWERMSDASFVYAVEKIEALGKWIHNRTLEIVRLSRAEWVGPWYRFPKQDRFSAEGQAKMQIGALETAHITLAVCEAIENCPELFSEEETAEIKEALRTKGMLMCRNFCDGLMAKHESINNWFSVLLNGYGTAAMVLNEADEIEHSLELSDYAAAMYNSNEYGESLQYSNYSSLALCSFYEHALRYGISNKRLHMECYTNLIPWYVASYLYNKPVSSLNMKAPRSINFGDSGAIFRPTGDLLVQIAARMRTSSPRAAGLASWLFEQTYQGELLKLPNDMATFGFINNFQYPALLLLNIMAEPVTPEQSMLSEAMIFGGQIILRDTWKDTKAVVAVMSGYEPYNATGHRHLDQGSFQTVYGMERLLVDPGHCCYRLDSQQKSLSDFSHNTFTLRYNGKVMHQQKIGGNIFVPKKPLNKRLFSGYHGDVFVTACDMTALFGAPVKKAVRVFLMKLPHMMFVADIVESDQPVNMDTHFVVNNRENLLNVHLYSENRIVFRRAASGMKLFHLQSVADGQILNPELEFGWSYMHDFYHPKPNQAGQGKEGSALCYRWIGKKPALVQRRLCSVIMSDEPGIRSWHVFPQNDGYFRMESPKGVEAIEVKLEQNCIYLRQPALSTEECIKF